MAHETIIRLPAVLKLVGVSRSTLYKMIAEKRFPRQIRLNERCVGWALSDVNQWICQRIADSREAETDRGV